MTQTAPDIPFVKTFPFIHDKADIVAPGVKRVICNNPGPFTYTGSGTYIISDHHFQTPAAIIDPGPNDINHIEALLAETATTGISHIFVTHTHSDHCGGARLLAEKCGSPIYGFGGHPVEDPIDDAPALDEGADYSFKPDHFLADGDAVKGTGWALEAVWTPGHLSNHLCFSLPAEQILFTGDHIMGWATTVIVPPDGNMQDYFQSLDKLLARDDRLYLPTHGAPIENPHRFVRAVRAHRRMRDGQIIQQLKEGREHIADMVAIMYAGIDKRLHVAASLNVLAHLIGLHAAGTVGCDGAPDLKARFYLIA